MCQVTFKEVPEKYVSLMAERMRTVNDTVLMEVTVVGKNLPKCKSGLSVAFCLRDMKDHQWVPCDRTEQTIHAGEV